MEGKRNKGHSVKGMCLEILPITEYDDIKKIRRLAAKDSARNEFLWVFSVQSGLRMIDCLRFRWSTLKDVSKGDTVYLKEGKRKKNNLIVINVAIWKALKRYKRAYGKILKDSDFIFFSRESRREKHMTSQYAGDLIAKYARAVGIKYRTGASTPRKTFGYIKRVRDGVPIELISARYNHESTVITKRYIHIQDAEIERLLSDAI